MCYGVRSGARHGEGRLWKEGFASGIFGDTVSERARCLTREVDLAIGCIAGGEESEDSYFDVRRRHQVR